MHGVPFSSCIVAHVATFIDQHTNCAPSVFWCLSRCYTSYDIYFIKERLGRLVKRNTVIPPRHSDPHEQ